MLGIAYKLMYEHIPENLRTQEFWDSLKFMREYTGRVAIIHSYQQPAAWSEEDKDKVVKYLHDKDGGMLWSKATEITEDILGIIRPQPHWKPSEEQMNVLKEAVLYFGNSWVSHKQEVLQSLYNDLKKL